MSDQTVEWLTRHVARPREGYTVYVVDEAGYYRWTGQTWVLTDAPDHPVPMARTDQP
jgi:hypothetical protein